jgi:hypothetical protein
MGQREVARSNYHIECAKITMDLSVAPVSCASMDPCAYTLPSEPCSSPSAIHRMFRSMIAGTTTAAIFGITFAIVSAVICGTAAVPFIFGSSIGFALGSFRWYAASSEEALIRLGSHTALMRLHLFGNFPREKRITHLKMEDYRREVFEKSWILKSMLTASWLTALPALDDIQAREEGAIIESYALGNVEGNLAEAGE